MRCFFKGSLVKRPELQVFKDPWFLNDLVRKPPSFCWLLHQDRLPIEDSFNTFKTILWIGLGGTQTSSLHETHVELKPSSQSDF